MDDSPTKIMQIDNCHLSDQNTTRNCGSDIITLDFPTLLSNLFVSLNKWK